MVLKRTCACGHDPDVNTAGRSGHLEPQWRCPQMPRQHAGHHLALRARRVGRHTRGGVQPRLPDGEVPGRGLAQCQLPPVQRARQSHVGRCVWLRLRVRLLTSTCPLMYNSINLLTLRNLTVAATGQYDGLSLNPLEQMFVKVKEQCVEQVLSPCRIPPLRRVCLSVAVSPKCGQSAVHMRLSGAMCFQFCPGAGPVCNDSRHGDSVR